MSEALAVTFTVPETEAPFVGAVIETVGGVLSITALETVTVTFEEVVVFPAASLAIAEMTWTEPLTKVVVSSEIP